MDKYSTSSIFPSDELESTVQIKNLETICEDDVLPTGPSGPSTISFTGTYTCSSESITDSSEPEHSLHVKNGNGLVGLHATKRIEIKSSNPSKDNCLLKVLTEKRRRNKEFTDLNFLWFTQKGNFDLKKTYASREPRSFVQRVQTNWEWRLYSSMTTMFVNAGGPLASLRSYDNSEAISANLGDARNCILGLEHHSPAYEPEEFLRALLRVRRQTACKVVRHKKFWNFFELPFETRTIPELVNCYQVIVCGELQRALTPRLTKCVKYLTLQQKRYRTSIILVQTGNLVEAKKFVKKSCPTSMRGPLWSMVLGVWNTSRDLDNFQSLKELVADIDLVVDKLSLIDVQNMMPINSPYFPHVDLAIQVMLLFSRDTDVRDVFGKCVAKPTLAYEGNAAGSLKNVVVYPPSGIIPFYGFCMFIAPMCSMYDDIRDIYFLFRAVYMHHFFRLHEVSSHPQGILCLCVLFERLLKTLEPELWEHFRKINDNPLRPIFKWLLRAFSGYLPVKELMILWDVIIAYDSLEVLPVLAVSIMIQRKSKLLEARHEKDVNCILDSISTIRCDVSLERTLNQMSASHRDATNFATQHETAPGKS